MHTAGKGIQGLALALASALSMAVGHAQTTPALTGFDTATSSAELELEGRFDKAIQPGNLKPWLERFAARPHHVGSPYDKANADYIAELFTSWGFDTRIERFDVLFPTPRTRVLELTAPTRYTARLAEPVLAEDSTSNQVAEQLPIYNAYSVNGDVTGPLVYVNYGVPADYDELARHGVDVKGAIVIARYGGAWRGIRPKVAAEHGAIGCLIYSDPREDGYFQGEVYPKGSFRGEWGAQRGSVMDMPLYPGDPLTPGVGATPEAKRLAVADAPTLTKIPVLPISYGDARPLLEALGGQTAPEAWRGALPLTYRLGPGPATVHLKVEFDFAQKPLYNVIARLAGRERPDQWVIRGNHHDAWVNGASDPVSGLIAMLAEAQAVGTLAKAGWRPRRTIVYAAWDGEEEGLLGSTEWVESHADELRAKAVAYINTDGYGRGFLSVGGSHGLERFVNEAARSVTDPETNVSVAARARAVEIIGADGADKRREIRNRGDLAIDALGSGSDFTPFLQHLGVPTLNVGFGGEDAGGEYHSIYDSIAHYERFGDPGFVYGPVLAQFGGRLVLRLADAQYLPVVAGPLAETINNYVKELVKLGDSEREKIDEENQRLKDRTYQLAADPTKISVPPKAEAAAPYLNLAPLQNASARLTSAAARFDAAVADASNASRLWSPESSAKLDAVLRTIDQAFSHEAGLPRRPWFRHQIYAPGYYTGYGVKTVPGVREAIEQHMWKEADTEAVRAGDAIGRAADVLDRATAIVTGR
jgi:N-acetylated-alpha-linked acidic dipeptidase